VTHVPAPRIACSEEVRSAPAAPAPPADMNDRLAQLKQVDHTIPGCQPPMLYRYYGLV
jgi:hypothetical protein